VQFCCAAQRTAPRQKWWWSKVMAATPPRIVSGGQSGVDRAALDVAMRRGLVYSGWCPRGGWAEDFPEPPGVLSQYPALRETPSRRPGQRTRWNVRDSDATLILAVSGAALSRGTAFTVTCAVALARPHLVVDLDAGGGVHVARTWLAEVAPGTLNVAGPRETTSPGTYLAAVRFMEELL
jgi:hypothetical protein